MQGDVIVSQISSGNYKGKTFEASGIINASLDDVYQVLVDFDDYDKFMPHIKNTEVLKKNSKYAVLNYTLGLPLGKIRKYRLYMTYSKNDDTAMIEWKMMEWPGINKSETINDTNGYWLLKNRPPGKNRVLALYHVYTDPGHIPWGLGWIIDLLIKRSVPNVVKKTRMRVYDMQRPGRK
jgi:uncharacterized membrane protein